MDKKTAAKDRAKDINETVRKLTRKKDAPMPFYAVILFLYIVTSVLLRMVASNVNMIHIFGSRVLVQGFAGVFSSISNICLIFLAVFYGKLGFLTAVVLLAVQFPMLAAGLVVGRNMTTIPGMFSNLFALVAVTVIYINHKRIVEE